MNRIRVAYASDENYAALTAISAVSVLRHNPNAEIILLGYNLNEDAKELVRSRVAAHGGVFSYCDVKGHIDPLVKAGCAKYTSYAVYSRFFIPEMLKDDGRVLYLDCDTLVTGSLAPLFEMEMGGCPVALGADAVPQCYKRVIGVPPEVPYFNSGSMLIDLARWRKRECLKRVMEDLANPPAPNPLPDQDVLVRVFAGEICPLEPKWNFLSQFRMLSYAGLERIAGTLPFAKAAYDEARAGGAVIHHFSGNTFGRPWYRESKHPMREAYREAARLAQLPDAAEQTKALPLQYKMQYWMWKLLPGCVFNLLYPYLLNRHIRRFYKIA